VQKTILYILASALLIVVHTTLIRFLAIVDIIPDILLLWIVYIAIREGQVAGTSAGFVIGLAVDLLSGQDGMLGLAAMSKTLGGFTAGYFFNENRTFQTLGGIRFIVAVGIASMVHNVIYFLIFLQGTEIGWWQSILLYGVPTTLYTAAIGLLPMFVFARRNPS
jgi:rod shape-determining protein MreD